MIKHGTKYINESENPEWFDELNLDNVIDAKTGRMLIPPPIGTEVTIKFIEDIPCRDHDRDHDEYVILDGEVIQYSKDDPNIILIMFHGGWQQECGWDCATEGHIPGDNGNKCYWIHISEEEVYIKGTQRIQESEEDDLEWARDTISQNPIPSSIKLCDGKSFSIPTHNNYKDKWAIFKGWNGWKDVIDIDSTLGKLCYVIYDHSYDRIYIPMNEFNADEIKFNTINESEDDDLEWARDTISQNPIPSRVKLGDGKRFTIPEYRNYRKYSKGWDNFVGWNYWKDVVRVDSKLGELCYVVNDSTYGDIYVPMTEFSPSEISFDRLNESEDDSLEWAQDIVSVDPTMKFSTAFNNLDNDDIISVSGELTDDNDEEQNVLCVLNNNKFKVNRKYPTNVQLTWLTPRTERPAGWQEVTNYGGPEHTDNLVLYYGTYAGFNDDNLDITFIEKVDHPF